MNATHPASTSSGTMTAISLPAGSRRDTVFGSRRQISTPETPKSGISTIIMNTPARLRSTTVAR